LRSALQSEELRGGVDEHGKPEIRDWRVVNW